jgi:hypothetical protein
MKLGLKMELSITQRVSSNLQAKLMKIHVRCNYCVDLSTLQNQRQLMDLFTKHTAMCVLKKRAARP